MASDGASRKVLGRESKHGPGRRSVTQIRDSYTMQTTSLQTGLHTVVTRNDFIRPSYDASAFAITGTTAGTLSHGSGTSTRDVNANEDTTLAAIQILCEHVASGLSTARALKELEWRVANEVFKGQVFVRGTDTCQILLSSFHHFENRFDRLIQSILQEAVSPTKGPRGNLNLTQQESFEEASGFQRAGEEAEETNVDVLRRQLVESEQRKGELLHLLAKSAEQNQALQAENGDLHDELKQLKNHADGAAFAFSGRTPADLDHALFKVRQSLSHCANTLLSLLKELAGKNDLPCASADIAAALGLRCGGARDLCKFVLRGAVAEVLFEDFENESFARGGFSCPVDRKSAQEMREQEARSLLAADGFPASLEALLGSKRRRLVAYFRDRLSTDQEGMDQVLWKSEELATHLRDLVKMVAALHKLAHSRWPPAQIIRRQEGDSVDGLCESVEGSETEPAALQRVRFMVFPGFRMGDVIVSRCQVCAEIGAA
jgi:hypothetical protein